MMKLKTEQYRWIILLAASLANFCTGSLNAWSVLSDPMAAELGVDSVTYVFSITNLSGMLMIVGAYMNDHYGPRWIVFIGGALYSLGMLFSGFVRTPVQLALTYGVCMGFGLSFVYGCTMNTVMKYFPERRGLVNGLVIGCYNMSAVAFAPLYSSLIAAHGVRATFHIISALFFVVLCGGALFMKKCPDGFLPEGYTPPPPGTSEISRNKTPGEMLRSPEFYLLFLLVICAGSAGMMTIANASGMAVNMIQATPKAAALYVSVLCLFNAGGTLFSGWLSDRLGRAVVLAAAQAFSILGFLLLLLAAGSASSAAFSVGIMLNGFTFGTFMGVFPSFCTDRFGPQHNTVNFSIIWLGFSIAGIIGPSILSRCYAARNSYSLAFLLGGLISLIGLIAAALCRMIIQRQNKASSRVEKPIAF